MLSRHANQLLARLERVEDVGCAEIRKGELLTWYDRERMTKSIWRDLLQKWEEVSDSKLLIGDSEGVWVLVYGKGMTTSQTSWLRDTRDLADPNGA